MQRERVLLAQMEAIGKWRAGLPEGVSSRFVEILVGVEGDYTTLVYATTDKKDIFYFGVKETPGEVPGSITRTFKADVSRTVGQNVIAGNLPR